MRALSLVRFVAAGAVALAVARPAAGQSGTVRQVMDGKELYTAYCAACHGADGRGDGPAAIALKTPPADLTSIITRHEGTFPRDRLVDYIVNGDRSIPAHGSKDMPVWGPNFAALEPGSARPVGERVEAIVAYLRSIQREK
jgi:mono/diheme cytochrome c family protein